MDEDTRRIWTQVDFDAMSWHDNYVHGLALREGRHGKGELVLDLDYILRWLKAPDGGVLFEIAPAELTFHEVWALRVNVDYAGAAMGPFSIMGIERRSEARERYTAQVWRLEVSFPAGEITFDADGFTQVLRGRAITKDEQWLTADERRRALAPTDDGPPADGEV